MSSILYSGGTIVDTTFTGDTRAAIATALIAELVNAGWTSISGSGTDQVLQSAATAEGSNSICMRVYDPATGNCARVAMRNAAGSLVSQDFYLLPGSGKTYRMIACKHNFFAMTPGASATREFVCGGTLAVPSFLNGVLTGDLGFIQGNGASDTDTFVRRSFRRSLNGYTVNGNYDARFSGLAMATLTNYTGSATAAGNAQLIVRAGAGLAPLQLTMGLRWYDGTLRTAEAELAWAPENTAGESQSFGFIHNCMGVSASYPADDRSITAYDGHPWHAVTSENNGEAAVTKPGTLFVAIG